MAKIIHRAGLTQAYLSLDEPKGATLESCDQIEADGLDRAHACCVCLRVPDPPQDATGARLGVAQTSACSSGAFDGR